MSLFAFFFSKICKQHTRKHTESRTIFLVQFTQNADDSDRIQELLKIKSMIAICADCTHIHSFTSQIE